MPRKQNGFGSANSFAFKGGGRVDKGKGVGAFGFYPSNRQFGSSVHRTIIENWNLNSNWSKWRKGYELYNIAAYSRFNVLNQEYDPGLPVSETNPEYVPAQLKSLLYQGTPYEIETLFTAIEMPTIKSDVNTHYVVKRFVSDDSGLAEITGKTSDNLLKQQRSFNEVWFKGVSSSSRARLLLQMLNERLTDGETEATLKNVLTKSTKLNLNIPAVYKGKTPTSVGLEQTDLIQTTVKVKIPIDAITIEENKSSTRIINQGLSTYTVPASGIDTLQDVNQLIGKIVYIQDFYVDKPMSALDKAEWQDYDNYFTLTVEETQVNKEIIVLDPGVSALPPSMYDINSLPKILTAIDSEYTIKGSYAFLKDEYQRFYERKYLTAELVKDEVEALSYSVFPFTILGAAVVGNYLELTSIPFTSEIKLYAEINDATLVFAENSFVKYVEPSSAAFTKAIDTNVDPWQDEVFTSKETLKPAEVYTCDCPSYSKTILAMPQATQNNDERKANRQERYPLPTVLSSNRFENLGIDKVAGKAASWEKSADKTKFKFCKHTVTGMFVDGVQLIEPSEYPTQEQRDLFEVKLKTEIEQLGDAWRLSAERGGISLTEIVFSLAQGLNLDDVETGYVVLNSN
jgi:hypothetical protein